MSAEIFVANWKSAGTREKSSQWIAAFNIEEERELLTCQNRIIIAPPLALLASVADQIERHGLPIAVAAENLDLEVEGVKHTGEGYIPRLVADCAEYVILGHTETRRDKGISAKDVNERLDIARKYGLKPIVCVANTEQATAIASHDSEFPGTIAYEPPANIGTGKAENPVKANMMCKQILELYPQASILYGGSVDAGNINDFLVQSSISGVLIGDKSSSATFFQSILRAATQ